MYGSSDPVCPFFAFYSLSEVSEAILPDNLAVSILFIALLLPYGNILDFEHTIMFLINWPLVVMCL